MEKWRIINCHNLQDNFNINNIKNVFNNNVDKEIVLCTGQVQSGKTKNIFACVDEALLKLDFHIAIIFAGTNNDLYNQTEDRLLGQKKEQYEYIFKNNLKNRNYKEGRKYVISILKNCKGLEDTLEFIYSIDLKNLKVLIIDDEADYASVNISRDKKSKIYEKICELYNKIYKGKLLQVTATPFANIISNKSLELKANRVVCWSTYDDYFGLVKFDELKKDKYKIVPSKKETKENYKSIEETIFYFISTIINNYDFLGLKSNFQELSCLINIDDDTTWHDEISKNIDKIVHDLYYYGSEKFYNDYIDKSINWNDYNNLLKDLISKKLTCITFNGNNNRINKKQFNIYVSGIKASRGFTFKNLICELILNSPENRIAIDVLLQRARWFGDRKAIIDYMKVFMNQWIYNGLNEAIDYVNLLTVGNHDIDSLYNKILDLDRIKQIVKSTNKE